MDQRVERHASGDPATPDHHPPRPTCWHAPPGWGEVPVACGICTRCSLSAAQ